MILRCQRFTLESIEIDAEGLLKNISKGLHVRGVNLTSTNDAIHFISFEKICLALLQLGQH
ncbi:hypothetical protein A7X88_11500 [Stenotrophomonas maltophilia]|nr:hypothetical protein A7X88_11500 [Stenotrophomonas maltophilia]